MTTDLQVFDELKAEVQALIAPTMQVQVTSPQSSQAALEALKTVKFLMLQLEKKRKEIVEPLKRRAKEVDDYARGIKDPLERAERHLKGECARFEEALEREREAKRREERARIEAEERKARERQAELEREIEAKRQAELEALKDSAKVAEGAAAFFGDDEPAVDLAEEKRRIDEAAERERIARQVEAEREQMQRVNAAKDREYDIEAARTKGAKKVWDLEVLDLEKVPRQYLKIEVNRAAVLAAARTGTTNIPGLRVFQKTDITVGAHTRIPEFLLEGKD